MDKVLICGEAGYIGSSLRPYLKDRGFHVDSLDRVHSLFESITGKLEPWQYYGDYAEVGTKWVNQYDIVIVLCGNSSVGLSKDPVDTFDQNVGKFVRFAAKLKPEMRLVYISSASVYGNSDGFPLREEQPIVGRSCNHYDWSKRMLEKAASHIFPNAIALRLGTVCGYSPNCRLDVIVNSMVYSARTEGVIRANNLESHRAILGMKDLCAAIEAILTKDWVPSIYNLASFNAEIGAIARSVKFNLEKHHGLTIKWERLEDTGTYSFALNCDKMKEVYGWVPLQSLNDIVDDCMNNFVPTLEELPKYVRR